MRPSREYLSFLIAKEVCNANEGPQSLNNRAEFVDGALATGANYLMKIRKLKLPPMR